MPHETDIITIPTWLLEDEAVCALLDALRDSKLLADGFLALARNMSDCDLVLFLCRVINGGDPRTEMIRAFEEAAAKTGEIMTAFDELVEATRGLQPDGQHGTNG